jgi:hypothetical protein
MRRIEPAALAVGGLEVARPSWFGTVVWTSYARLRAARSHARQSGSGMPKSGLAARPVTHA